MIIRKDGRGLSGIRPVKIEKGYLKYAEGSAYMEIGNTKVICSASIEEKVPPFLKGTGEGWITAEYGMLPRSTQVRKVREVTRGHVEGRTAEIQRLIGRSLRSAINLKALGERTLWVDADVIQADGGTRTASITAGFIALVDAIRWMKQEHLIEPHLSVIQHQVAAVSVGILNSQCYLDLTYEEDSVAEVDLNVVMTDKEEIVDIQGTGEKRPYTPDELQQMLTLAKMGIKMLVQEQKKVLGLEKKPLP